MLKLALNIKINSKIARNEETESVGKTNSREKPPHQRNQRNLKKFREIFTIVKMIIMENIN